MALVDLFWDRVKEAIEASPQGRKGVKAALHSMERPRNKNTYTSWFGNTRPDIRISDVEDLAAALNVEPAGLLVSNGRHPKPIAQQLEFPFEAGNDTVTVKIQCASTGIIVRSAKD